MDNLSFYTCVVRQYSYISLFQGGGGIMHTCVFLCVFRSWFQPCQNMLQSWVNIKSRISYPIKKHSFFRFFYVLHIFLYFEIYVYFEICGLTLGKLVYFWYLLAPKGQVTADLGPARFMQRNNQSPSFLIYFVPTKLTSIIFCH